MSFLLFSDPISQAIMRFFVLKKDEYPDGDKEY